MNRKIKVIQLINGIVDGGAETLVRDYALYINQEKFDLHILTEAEPNNESANVRILQEHGIKIHSAFINRTSFIKKVVRWVQNRLIRPKYRDIYRRWFLQRYILHIRPDVIHVHMKMLHYLVPIADQLNGVKLYYTCHSLPCRYFNNEEDKAELDAARYLIEHNGLRMIGLHEAMKNELNEMFGVNNSLVIKNCVNIAMFRDVKQTKEEIRAELGIPHNAFVLGHVGRFIWLKNQPFLVDVLTEVIKVCPNAFLLLIGDGEKEETLMRIEERSMSEHCLILSHRKDVNILLKAMDVFVFPSKLEGLGIAPIEAQASGLKCYVSSNVPKDVCLSENAVMLDLEDGAAYWAQAILNDVKGQYRGNIDDFDIPRVMEAVEELYLE